jgi:hypothetical protein
MTGPATTQDGRVQPAAGTEQAFAAVLAEVMRVDQVPVDSDFFADLAADLLVMAHFCARVRKRADLPSVSIREIYRHPTIQSLAQALGGGPAPAPASPSSRSAARTTSSAWAAPRCRR